MLQSDDSCRGADCNGGCGLEVGGWGLGVVGWRLGVAGWGLWVVGCGLGVVGCLIHDLGSTLQVNRRCNKDNIKTIAYPKTRQTTAEKVDKKRRENTRDGFVEALGLDLNLAHDCECRPKANPKCKSPNTVPQTPNPKPQTPNPKPQTPNPKPQTKRDPLT